MNKLESNEKVVGFSFVMQFGIGDDVMLLPLFSPCPSCSCSHHPPALSILLCITWCCLHTESVTRQPCVINGFPLQACSVLDRHKTQIIFGMDTQKYTGLNGFILNGIQNMQNIQLNLSPVHRQNGRSPPRCEEESIPAVSDALTCFVLEPCLILQAVSSLLASPSTTEFN